MGIPYYGQKIVCFGGFDPQDPRQYYSDPQKAHPSAKPRLLSHQPSKSLQPFGLCVGLMEIKTEKKTGNILLYVAYLCRPPLYAINTILVWFHHIPDAINHANFGVDRVIGV
jgi:hypothetical protein